ncbi:hypothetical protein [Streptomyces sp. NPDC089795]|uniref:hypothetical protein n=1 Tax=Streptomyces sp. NPDC089795 TaxID=3155297 RepID=UPI003442CEF2
MKRKITVAALTGAVLLSAVVPAFAVNGGGDQGSTFANERTFADFFGLDSKDSTQRDLNLVKPANVLDDVVADLVNQPSQ